MTDFNRTFNPRQTTWPRFPAGLDAWGQSGKGQFRSFLEVGRTWEESYSLMSAKDSSTRAFFAYINKLWRDRTIFDIMHLDLQTPYNTPITGSILVNGSSQTGSTINVTSTLNKKLLAGDVIKFANINLVYDIAADMASPTASSISISPPIFTNGSPSHGASITFTGVKFRCVLHEDLKLPDRVGGGHYAGLVLKFRECP